MRLRLFIFLSFFTLSSVAQEKVKVDRSVRIKDLVTINGVRSNPLIGYGIVVGLNGTGDGGGDITNQSLRKMFQTLGLDPKDEVSSSNVAAVIVTAELKPFSRVGQRVDVKVSSIGAASSLAGGTLLVTPLKAGDGNIYAIANGSISIGGIDQGKGFATTGRIPDGGTVEKELEINFHQKEALRLSLKNPDFTTSARVVNVINKELGGRFASAKDATTVDLIVPTYYKRKVIDLVAVIENFKVVPDQAAVIVINERTGTLVAGGEVRISKAALSHKSLVLEVDGGSGSLKMLKETPSVNDLVKTLNALGAKPEDLISIFQTLKQNGALTADIKLL